MNIRRKLKEKALLKVFKGGYIVSNSIRFNYIIVYNNGKFYTLDCIVNDYKYGLVKSYNINCTHSTIIIKNSYNHDVMIIHKDVKIKKIKGTGCKDVYKI